MRKLTIKLLIIILLVGIILYGRHRLYLEQTPERMLKSYIDFKKFDYTIELHEEQWIPFNGNGHRHIVIRFNELTQENLDYLKKLEHFQPLPISEKDRRFMTFVPSEILTAEKGYYLYKAENISEGKWEGKNYVIVYTLSVFIVDIENKVAIFYYHVM